MKATLKALLPATAFGLCLAVTGCNTEEVPPAPAPAPSATAPAAPGGEATPAPEAKPADEAPKVEAPAEAKPAEEAPKA